MADDELKLETKCYDANEYGYLYGLNKKIRMKILKRSSHISGNSKEWIL